MAARKMSLRILAFIAALAPLALPAQEVVRQSAPVVIANRMIIELHGPIAGHTAEERAQGSIARIEAALDADPKAEVSYGETEEGTRVRVGGHHAFTVTRIDIDPEIGETTLIVAREAVGRLEQAIVERREQHSPGTCSGRRPTPRRRPSSTACWCGGYSGAPAGSSSASPPWPTRRRGNFIWAACAGSPGSG
jgi:hypothetical protein